MTNKIELSIIIVSYNVKELLLECIGSVISTCQSIEYELFVVDNASRDGSAQAVRERFPMVTVIEKKTNEGFARANNEAYRVSSGAFILLLNPDVFVKPGAIGASLAFLKSTPDAGIAGCRLVNRDGSLQYSIDTFPSIMLHVSQTLFLNRLFYPKYKRESFYYQQQPVRVDYVSGAFFMVRRGAITGNELLNHQYFMYSEEKDLALSMKRNGYRSYFLPTVESIHYGESSSSQTPVPMFLQLQKSQLLFFNQHHAGLKKSALVWSYYTTLMVTTVASFFLAVNSRGRNRLNLFINVVRRYPIDAWKIIYQPWITEWINWIEETIRLFKIIYVNPKLRIHIYGGAEPRHFFKYFNMPHPRYKIIKNKTFGVALLELPGSFETYMQGKHREYLRRMKNRAIREKYVFRRVDPHEYFEDMLEINRSLPMRQGRPMEEMYLDHKKVEDYFKGKNEIFAIFNNADKLRAYAYVPHIGDVCLFDRLLGHVDDLEKGVMYFLLSEVIREMIEKKQTKGAPIWVEYDTFIGGSQGIRYFKEKLWFRPYRVKWVWSVEEKPSEN